MNQYQNLSDQMSKSNKPAARSTYRNLTLADLFMFFHRLRMYLIAGLFFGIVSGTLVAYFFSTPGYYTRIYLSADRLKHAAMTDPKAVTKIFSNALISSWGSEALFNVLEENSTQFTEEREKLLIRKDSFILRMMSGQRNYQLVMKSLSDSDEYMVDLYLPVKALGDQAGYIVQKALNTVAEIYNKRIAIKFETKRQSSIKKVEFRYSEAEKSYSHSVLTIFEQLHNFRKDLVNIEYALTAYLPIKIRNSEKQFLTKSTSTDTSNIYVPVESSQGNQQTSVMNMRKAIQEFLQHDMNHLLKMAAVIKNHNIAPVAEIDALIERAYSIRKSATALDSGRIITEAKMALSSSSLNLTKLAKLHSQQPDEAKSNLPAVTINTTLNPENNSNTIFETKHSNRLTLFSLTIVLSLLFSILIGIIHYSFRRIKKSIETE